MTRNPDYQAYLGPRAGRLLTALDHAWTLVGLALVALALVVLASGFWAGWTPARLLVGGGLLLGGIVDLVWGRRWRRGRSGKARRP